jgi:hypothetical protein
VAPIAFNVPEVPEQIVELLTAIETVEPLDATAVVAVFVQPFVFATTVQVYTPAEFTVTVEAFAPETIPGPCQLYVPNGLELATKFTFPPPQV